MAEEQEVAPPHEQRKTVSFTHKQLGWSGGIIAALTLVAQLKGSFISREEGVAQNKDITALQVSQDREFAEVKQQIATAQVELERKIERSNDKAMDHVREAEARAVKNAETQDHRIDMLEQAVLQFKSKYKSN